MLSGFRTVTCGKTCRQRDVYVHHTYLRYMHTERQVDRQVESNERVLVNRVAKTPKTFVVKAVCVAYLVYQFI